ncbi:MAG: hypothetical protein APF76_06775 [Desulfitibacter sp. BRH_c19]|nr:MAG: hypothetical protein APF76_06775 [Desulfitibacter sp. BRH_c19]
MIFIFLIAFLILVIVAEKIIINKFNIKKKKGLYKHVNKVHKWSEVVIIIALITMTFFSKSSELRQYYLPIFFTVLFGFRAFIEWKFEKESKVYILSILNGSTVLLLLIILKLFFLK